MQSLSEQSDINQEYLLLQDAATRKDATFLPRILLALDDDSEHIDLMKDLIGLRNRSMRIATFRLFSMQTARLQTVPRIGSMSSRIAS